MLNARGPCQLTLRNYRKDQEGQDIESEDVMRANNGKWCTEEETKAFVEKSIARCPTCGTCLRCMSSGPVGKTCNSCKTCDSNFPVIMVIPTFTGRQWVVDSKNLARLFKAEHEVAKADRMHDWLRTPSVVLSRGDFTTLVRS